jgi:hypothetical protein
MVNNTAESHVVYIPLLFRCGHCKAMAADWETLGAEYQSSSSVLIAEVDCTLVSVASSNMEYQCPRLFILDENSVS